MPIPTIVSLKSGGLVLGIVVSAAGLNLSVMQLNETSESTEVSAVAPPEPAITTTTPSSFQASVPVEPAPVTPLAAEVPTPPPPTGIVVPVAAAPTQAPPTTLVRVTTALPASVPAAPTTQVTAPARPTTEYMTYTFDGIADIVVALHDGERMEFWSVAPAPGWSFKVETQTDTKIKIKFGFGHEEEDDEEKEEHEEEDGEDEEDEAEFELKLAGGEIRVKAER